jgi:hypothetical protein
VSRDDGTDKLNFRACLHGSPFLGVLEKVPLYLSLSNCARATARAMNLMDQIFPDVNMTVLFCYGCCCRSTVDISTGYFPIVRKMIYPVCEARQVSLSFVITYFWKKPLTA